MEEELRIEKLHLHYVKEPVADQRRDIQIQSICERRAHWTPTMYEPIMGPRLVREKKALEYVLGWGCRPRGQASDSPHSSGPRRNETEIDTRKALVAPFRRPPA